MFKAVFPKLSRKFLDGKILEGPEPSRSKFIQTSLIEKKDYFQIEIHNPLGKYVNPKTSYRFRQLEIFDGKNVHSFYLPEEIDPQKVELSIDEHSMRLRVPKKPKEPVQLINQLALNYL